MMTATNTAGLWKRRLRIRLGLGLLIMAILFPAGDLAWRKTTPFQEIGKKDPVSAMERKFSGLKIHLPPRGKVGYITDLGPDRGSAGFAQTQYVLTPLVLEKNMAHSLVVGNFESPPDLAAICRENSLAVVEDLGNGAFLLRKTD